MHRLSIRDHGAILRSDAGVDGLTHWCFSIPIDLDIVPRELYNKEFGSFKRNV